MTTTTWDVPDQAHHALRTVTAGITDSS